ncbi:hypothetical protein RHMOL_Rhmol03G0245900 [Rhododendron molle]|uniref:Uncharacterized protein n=1 Tax=Rhododendron molle TaxID=49168 RepID=A0ACC0PIC7_RHOML|nr:hypothetical protein RHMOL_Rhmol03G0245900 [Rhododendron molle]
MEEMKGDMPYASPPDFYSGCPLNSVFGSDFWEVEINTVADSCPAGGGFVNRRERERERERRGGRHLCTATSIPPSYENQR